MERRYLSCARPVEGMKALLPWMMLARGNQQKEVATSVWSLVRLRSLEVVRWRSAVA